MRSTVGQIRGMRIAAFLLDVLAASSLLVLAGAGLTRVALLFGRFGPPTVRGIWLVCWLLFVGAILLRDALPGGSPGRRLLGLAITGRRGAPTVGESIRRNLPLLVPFWGLFELRRLRTAADQRRFGDRWGGTRVEEL